MSRPVQVTEELLRGMPLPDPGEGSKEERGRVFVLAGSVEVPGAALLAGTGALRAGAGKLRIATARTLAPHLGLAMPEALVIGLPETGEGGIDPASAESLRARLDPCDALLIGPGMVGKNDVRRLTRDLLAGTASGGIVLDAAALPDADDPGDLLVRYGGRMIVTPHAGEMARMLGCAREEVEADPLRAAREAAGCLQGVVVMKGSSTHIVAPRGEAWLYEGGGVGLATSGSGDVLAGVVAGLLARGAKPVEAAVWGVYLHGEAGARLSRKQGRLGFLARELPAEIPAIIGGLERV